MGNSIRFGIALTYRCGLRCQWCNRFLNVLPWPNSDIRAEDLHSGWEKVKAAGLEVEKVRVTGGEPLLHPQFRECMLRIRKEWDTHPTRRVPVFTSMPPKEKSEPWTWRYKTSTHLHQPPMISPADLGYSIKTGVESTCRRQRGCGRLFDAFGFSFCIYAGALGRLLGIDPYSPVPVLNGVREICRHCPWSIGVRGAFRLFRQHEKGNLEYPTKTYREALQRAGHETLVLPKYGERQ
jgi:hypothetical protein